jgi:multicomponent Na+:H+ antiporter subunit B
LKVVKVLLLVGFAALMFFAAIDLPMRGDADSVMHQEVNANGNPVPGNYYIQSAYKDAKTPNIVTVVLGDYRSIDTLGEQIVVFTAGLILVLVLSGSRKKRENG